MKVLIIVPRYVDIPFSYYNFPLGLGYIAAVAKKSGYNVSGLNLNETHDSIEIALKKKIEDTGVWSTFENTCLNAILITESCKDSKAFICAKPLSVNLIGEREWGEMYEFIEIVRIPELIDFYRSKGLGLKKYLINKNYSLRNFGNYFIKIIFSSGNKGKELVNFRKHFFKNLIYPNVYISILSSLIRKIKNCFKKK